MTLIQLFFRYYYRFHPPECVKYGQGSGVAKCRVRIGKDGSRNMEIEGEKYWFPGFPRQHVLIGGSLQKFKKAMKFKIFHAMFNIVPAIKEDELSPFLKDIWRVFRMMKHAEITEDMRSEVWNLCLAYTYFMHKGKDVLSGKELMNTLKPLWSEVKYDMIPIEQCCSFVKEIWNALTELEKLETDEDIKDFERTLKKFFCFFMQEDDAWRFRWQWVFERFNRKIYSKYDLADLANKNNYQVRFQFVLSQMNYNKCKLSKIDKYHFRGKWFRPEKFTKKGKPKFDY